jgi:hypothetical protein
MQGKSLTENSETEHIFASSSLPYLHYLFFFPHPPLDADILWEDCGCNLYLSYSQLLAWVLVTSQRIVLFICFAPDLLYLCRAISLP